MDEAARSAFSLWLSKRPWYVLEGVERFLKKMKISKAKYSSFFSSLQAACGRRKLLWVQV